jgi:hypothetical protein
LNEKLLSENMREHLSIKYIELFKAEENPLYLEDETAWRSSWKKNEALEGCTDIRPSSDVKSKPMTFKFGVNNNEDTNPFEIILKALREYLGSE